MKQPWSTMTRAGGRIPGPLIATPRANLSWSSGSYTAPLTHGPAEARKARSAMRPGQTRDAALFPAAPEHLIGDSSMRRVKRSRKVGSVAKMAELAIAAPQVVAVRTARMLAAGVNPGAADRAEFSRMGTEKVQAFWES